MKKHPRLILFFTSLFVVVCQTVTPSATPTVTPVMGAEEIPPDPPIVTGALTYCNIPEGRIDFELTASRPELVDFGVRVWLNDELAECHVAAESPGVLSCTLLSELTLPVTIVTMIGDGHSEPLTIDGVECAG